ncbi:MAG: response regulator [Verrucomicrobiota bacterium JB022]|nr:response regulator [Verrucomicrobiota bacterium JB022]
MDFISAATSATLTHLPHPILGDTGAIGFALAGLMTLVAAGAVFWAKSSCKGSAAKVGTLQEDLEREQEARRQSEQKQQQLLAAAKSKALEADAANRAKNTLLSNMSHELRTPLNTVLGLSEVLLTTELNAEQTEYMQAIKGSGQTLLNVISNILDYANLETGRLELKASRFDLGELVAEVESMFRVEARRKNLRFACRLAEEGSINIQTDREHFRRVLVNIVSNAINRTDSGDVAMAVYRQRLQNGEKTTLGEKLHYRLTIVLADTGPDLSDEERDQVFNPYQQTTDTSAPNQFSNHLSLALSKRIIEAMDGEATIEPNRPRGMRFKATVEVAGFVGAPIKEAAANKPKPSMYKQALAKSFYSQQVLVVDDNAANRKVAMALLKKMGHESDFAENGQEALDALREKDYDLVLMDIQMPVMGGVEATEKIRAGAAGEKNEDIPIIAVTAFAMTADRERYLACGMDYYITKPLKPDTLREVLTHVARKK